MEYYSKFTGAEVDELLQKVKDGGGGSVTIDTELSETSMNPLANATVTAELKKKVNAVEGKVLSSNDFTDDDKEKLAGLENYDDSALKADIAKKADKGDIVTPDWNAEEGEAGYIENRTHYKHITNAELECITHSDEFSEYGQPWHTWGGGEYDSLKIDRFPAEIIIEGGDYGWTVTLEKVNTRAILDVIEMDRPVNIAAVYLEEYEGYYYLKISDYGYDNHILDGALNVTHNEYIPLNENYIPNTIARKSDLEGLGSGSLTAEEVSSTEPTASFPQVLYTAQSLSEEQKEQARENIGVDKELEGLIGAMDEGLNGLAETIAANYPTRQEVSDAIASAITNVLNEEV